MLDRIRTISIFCDTRTLHVLRDLGANNIDFILHRAVAHARYTKTLLVSAAIAAEEPPQYIEEENRKDWVKDSGVADDV